MTISQVRKLRLDKISDLSDSKSYRQDENPRLSTLSPKQSLALTLFSEPESTQSISSLCREKQTEAGEGGEEGLPKQGS